MKRSIRRLSKIRCVLLIVALEWVIVQLFLLSWLDTEADSIELQKNDTSKRPSLLLPKIVFGGIMKNMIQQKGPGYLDNDYLPKLLDLAQTITSDFHIVIYENDSLDDTRSTLLRFLRENAQLESHFTLLLEDNVVGETTRLV
jgi:hypothetical protein